MKFPCLKFKEGVNLTVRRGDADLLNILDSDGIYQHDFSPIVISKKLMRFQDLKDEDLVNEHDPDCRTYAGLFKKMEEYYPGFDEREIVTLIEFEIEEL